MLGGLGVGELALILVIALVFFGAKRLPELARSIGGSLKAFKQGLKEGDKDPDPPA
ncbi:MAG: twin-arginine translocase TatA/TatE family subunit [Elusimicrobia bacterium]|nr:twin-arginine translocase TatA/TatE family subunit [Elusimicrobiota bacterium]